MGLWSSMTGWIRSLAPHDGGSFDRSNKNWTPVDGTGEAINQVSRDVIRNRARDLERNSDIVSSVIDPFERGVVGTGIRLQAKVMEAGEDNEELNAKIEQLWNRWCRYDHCDVTGQLCFSEMQRQGVRRRLVDGGLFYILCVDPKEEFPLKLQIKEVDELDTSTLYYGQGRGKNKVVGGIELDPFGKTVAYHFKEYDVYGWNGKSVRVEAKHVIYLNYKNRPSEVREFSPLGKILPRLRDLNQYINAVSVKERVLACLSVFIKKAAQVMNFGNPKNRDRTDSATGYRTQTLSPGMINYLDAGDSVEVVNPSGQASNAKDFVSMLQHSIGAAMGLSYEATTRDMSQVNYSSARQGLLDDQRTYQIWQHYIIEHFCQPVYEKFLECCVLSGKLDIPGFFTEKEKYIRCEWIPNGMSWIDPLKEVRANEYALNSNQITLEEICASRGQDYRDVLRQRKKEKELMIKYGLQPAETAVSAGGEGEE